MSAVSAMLVHLRPRSWPVVFGHYACGTAIALYHAPAGTRALCAAQALAGGVIWTIAMNGGTLAINSAFDRDEGDIGYLDNPPPVPRGLAAVSLALLLAGMAASLLLPTGFAIAYAICLVLSLLYSVPPIRLKAVAGADLLINMAGYGALTIAAGALATGVLATQPRLAGAVTWLAASYALLFGAFYPMTQIYQIPEDTARGDRTLVVRVGARRALQFSCLMAVASLLAQLAAGSSTLLHLAWWSRGAVVAAYAVWIAFILHWLHAGDAYPLKAGMYRALKLWGATSIVTVLAFTLGTTP